MNVIDISWPISPAMTAYKDRKIVQVTPTKIFEKDHVRESVFTLGSHTGTHIDAPAHFLQNGATVDQITLTKLIGLCRVLDLTVCTEVITAADLMQHAILPGQRILIKTRNSQLAVDAPFNPEFVYVDVSAAEYLAAQQVVVVGIDYLGIERNQPKHETHEILLQAGIVIIEGLRLAEVVPGDYNLMCLPLNILGVDGVPARAILHRT